jgi:glycosyltransferase involved in cell wall biosynthesis
VTPHRLERLLLACPGDRLGGTERHTALLAAGLAARGFAVSFAAPAAILAALAPPGCTLLPLDAGLPAARPDAMLIALPWPDAAPDWLAPLAGSGLPRLVLLHLVPHDPSPMAGAWVAGSLFAAVSAPLARRAEAAFGLPPMGCALLANPPPDAAPLDRAATRTAMRAALGLPADAPLLLFLGRLEAAKGADWLPGISARLPATLAVAGAGPMEGLISAGAASDPRGLLRPLGHLPDPAPWIAAADALILPSRLEGAPLAFLEAAAAHCPVVATPTALEALGRDAAALAWIGEGIAGLAEAARACLADPVGAAARARLARSALASRPWSGGDWDATLDRAEALLRAAFLPAMEEA